MLIIIIMFQYYYEIVIISEEKKTTPGELCFSQTQHVKTSTNLFKKFLETDFYKVLYNPERWLSVSNNESHAPVGSELSQCEGWSEEPLPATCHDGFHPQGMGLIAVIAL